MLSERCLATLSRSWDVEAAGSRNPQSKRRVVVSTPPETTARHVAARSRATYNSTASRSARVRRTLASDTKAPAGVVRVSTRIPASVRGLKTRATAPFGALATNKARWESTSAAGKAGAISDSESCSSPPPHRGPSAGGSPHVLVGVVVDDDACVVGGDGPRHHRRSLTSEPVEANHGSRIGQRERLEPADERRVATGHE